MFTNTTPSFYVEIGRGNGYKENFGLSLDRNINCNNTNPSVPEGFKKRRQ